MKRWLGLTVIILLLAVAVGLVFLLKFERKIPLDRLLPARSILVVELKDLDNIWGRVIATRFWRALQTLAPWKGTGIETGLQKFRRNIELSTGFALNRPNLAELAGQDIILAVVGEEDEATLVLLSRLGLRGRGIELLARLGGRWRIAESENLKEERYKGKSLVLRHPSPSFPVYAAYCLLGNCVAMTLSQGDPSTILKEVIDLASEREKVPAFRDEPGYQVLRKSALNSGASAAVYLKCDRLIQFIRSGSFPVRMSLPPSLSPAGEKLKRELAGGIEALKTLTAEFVLREGLRSRIQLRIDRERLREIWGERIPSAGEAETLSGRVDSFVPRDSVLYLTGRTDFLQLAREFDTLGPESAPDTGDIIFSGLRHWGKEIGLDLKKDILSVVGKEAAFFLEGVSTEGLLPLPQAGCILEIKDRAGMMRALDKISMWLAARYNLAWHREKYSGVEVTSFRLLLTQPAYAFLDGFLLLGSSQSLLQKMVDVWAGEHLPLTSHPRFQKVVAPLETAASAFFYLNSEKLLQQVSEVGDWWLGMQKIISPGSPEIDEGRYQNKVIPFLRLLEVFKAIGWKERRKEEIVIHDAYWYIEDIAESEAKP